MHNIVSLGAERPRPSRAFLIPREGARILFFTGVRYCRDDPAAPSGVSSPLVTRVAVSDRALDAAAH